MFVMLHEGDSISGHCGDMSLLCLITVFYIQFLIRYVAIPSTDMYMYYSMSKVLDILSLTSKQGLCAVSAICALSDWLMAHHGPCMCC